MAAKTNEFDGGLVKALAPAMGAIVAGKSAGDGIIKTTLDAIETHIGKGKYTPDVIRGSLRTAYQNASGKNAKADDGTISGYVTIALCQQAHGQLKAMRKVVADFLTAESVKPTKERVKTRALKLLENWARDIEDKKGERPDVKAGGWTVKGLKASVDYRAASAEWSLDDYAEEFKSLAAEMKAAFPDDSFPGLTVATQAIINLIVTVREAKAKAAEPKHDGGVTLGFVPLEVFAGEANPFAALVAPKPPGKKPSRR